MGGFLNWNLLFLVKNVPPHKKISRKRDNSTKIYSRKRDNSDKITLRIRDYLHNKS